MKKIQIGIITYAKFCNNEPIINLVIYLLHKFAKYPENLEFLLITHYKHPNFNLNRITNFTNNLNIRTKHIDLGNEKLGHNQTLERTLFKYDADYGFFFDSDLLCLRENWDELFINELEKEKTIAIGTSYHKLEQKYMNFPNIMGFFFKRKEFQDMCSKILEKPNSSIFAGNKDYVKIIKSKYGHNGYKDHNGKFVRHEIGFLLPLYFHRNDYKGIPFPCIRLDQIDKCIFSNKEFLEIINNYNKKYIRKNIGMTLTRRGFEEYHYNNELMFVHIGAGSLIRFTLFYQTPVFKKFLELLRTKMNNDPVINTLFKL